MDGISSSNISKGPFLSAFPTHAPGYTYRKFYYRKIEMHVCDLSTYTLSEYRDLLNSHCFYGPIHPPTPNENRIVFFSPSPPKALVARLTGKFCFLSFHQNFIKSMDLGLAKLILGELHSRGRVSPSTAHSLCLREQEKNSLSCA